MKKNTWLLMILFGLGICSAFGQHRTTDDIFGERNEVYFSFHLDDLSLIPMLSRIISLDDLDPASGKVYAYANREAWEEFLDHGTGYEILTPPSMLTRDIRMVDKVDLRNLNDWDFYPTYDGYVDMMNQYAADYPDICEVFSIGGTYHERDILVAKISDNAGVREAEPQFFYTSSMHGDETAGYVLMLRLIDHLLSNYGEDPRITHMVDNIEIWINPLANPDGAYASGNSNIYGATRYNAQGVDLNRNFPDPEDGPHPDGNAWQIETCAFMDVAEENQFAMSCNIHGGAEVANYPWDTWWFPTADEDWWIYVCREYADTAQLYSPPGYFSGFNNGITNGYAWYTISGGRQDYMTYFHQGREFTLEISNTKLVPASQLPDLWEYNYRSFLNYMEQVLYGVTGTVTDKDSQDPLRAEVFVLDHEEDSSWAYSGNEHGNYHRLLYEGSYDIRFSSPGYIPETVENVMVTNRDATDLHIALTHQFSGMEEMQGTDFNIYPNPVSGNYFLVTCRDEIIDVYVMDITGKEIFHQSGIHEHRAFVETSGWINGPYVVLIYTPGGIYSGKLEII